MKAWSYYMSMIPESLIPLYEHDSWKLDPVILAWFLNAWSCYLNIMFSDICICLYALATCYLICINDYPVEFCFKLWYLYDECLYVLCEHDRCYSLEYAAHASQTIFLKAVSSLSQVFGFIDSRSQAVSVFPHPRRPLYVLVHLEQHIVMYDFRCIL